MPIGKNSLARAAKQVSEAKHKETLTEEIQKNEPQAVPLAVLSEKVPSDETSRPAISPISDVTVTPDHLPAIDVSDALATEAATPTPKKAAAGKSASKKTSPKASGKATKASAKSSPKATEAPSAQIPAETPAEAPAEASLDIERYALGDDLPYYLL